MRRRRPRGAGLSWNLAVRRSTNNACATISPVDKLRVNRLVRGPRRRTRGRQPDLRADARRPRGRAICRINTVSMLRSSCEAEQVFRRQSVVRNKDDFSRCCVAIRAARKSDVDAVASATPSSRREIGANSADRRSPTPRACTGRTLLITNAASSGRVSRRDSGGRSSPFVCRTRSSIQEIVLP